MFLTPHDLPGDYSNGKLEKRKGVFRRGNSRATKRKKEITQVRKKGVCRLMNLTRNQSSKVDKIVIVYDDGQKEVWNSGLGVSLEYDEEDQPKQMHLRTTQQTGTLEFLDILDAITHFIKKTFLGETGSEENGSTKKDESSS